MRVLHLISGLSAGGAETVLCKLLSRLEGDDFRSEVVSLGADGPVGDAIRSLGVPVATLNMKPGQPDPRLVTRGRAHILRRKPDLIQTWMYHADLVGGIAARLGSAPPVIWNIRHTLVRRSDLKHSTLLVARVNAALSRLIPARIVCCAESALETHLRLGYARDKMLVIPNGFDLELFRPNPTARAEVRFALGVDETSPLIGLCGRFDLQKDHNNFFRAAGILHATRPDANFVLWGRGVDSANSLLAKWISAEDLQASVHLLGFRTDSQHINAALDIGTLSAAYGEAFPNVIGEAMSCGIPCVVTDVGDSAKIVGNTGRVVPPRQPEALAAAWQELLQLDPEERAGLGGRARQRVVDLFSLDRMADAYAELYRDIIGGARRLPAGS